MRVALFNDLFYKAPPVGFPAGECYGSGFMRTLVLITLSAVLVAMMIAPNMIGRYPPMQDLPNHLARIHFLTMRPAALTEMFAVNWSVQPNLGFDLVMVALAQFFSVDIAAKIITAVTIALLPISVQVLHWAAYRRFTWVGLLAIPLCNHQALTMGFAAFSLGAPLAICGFALWVRIADWPYLRRQAVLLCVTTSLYFIHLYALGALAVLVGGWTFARRFEALGDEKAIAARLMRAAGRALPDAAAFPPPLLLLLLLPTSTSLLEFMSITFVQKITMTVWSMSPLLSWTGALALAPALLLVLFLVWRAPPVP